MSYRPPVGAATSSTRGLIKLTGDFGGTADSPTVPGLAAKIDASQKGVANGVASLDSGGKLPSAQLQVTFPVTTVAGRVGDVTLTQSDVGLTNVDNTADASKPISSAAQTALNAKADASATTTALAGKANTIHSHTATQISDSTAVGRAVLIATDAAAAQSALAIANTVQVVNAFTDVTTPVYGTLYVVRA